MQDQVQGQLAASARVFESVVDSRVKELASRALILAQDFGFRQAVGTEDQPTIKSALLNLGKRIGADLALAYDPDGNVIASAAGALPRSFAGLILGLENQRSKDTTVARIIAMNGKLYEIVVVPVFAPDLLAWIVLGKEMNRTVAQEIKSLSPIELDIAFLFENGSGDYEPAASTSNADMVRSFLREAITPETVNPTFKTYLAGENYMLWHIGFDRAYKDAADNSQAGALLYFSMDKAMQPYMSLALALLGVLALGLIILVMGSVVISRGVTRPLRQLASAANRIAKGDYQEVKAPTKGDEIADLTSSFNRMVDAVRDREDRIVYQAYHDTETGLFNRNQFERTLQEHIDKKGKFCVVIAEVQHVAELRSVLDHTHINELLKGIGTRIAQVTNIEVARLSSDSFVFLLDDMNRAEVVASLIINSFMTPFEVTDIVVDASVKLGLSKFPNDSTDSMKLMQAASSALDQGRTATKGYAWFVASTGDAYKQRLSLMSELREALKSGDVSFSYQPKLDLGLGKVNAVEALVRWNSSTRGFVPPDDFIPFAERTGDIKHLTEWGLRKAVSQCAQWRSKGLHLAVAVNLSTNDLMNMNLPGQILALLRDFNVPASLLKLEVTESAVMHDMARALEVLNMLSAMGLTLSIDDYGTGYSSLSYLKRLPVSEIKIDKSFVMKLAENEEDQILVRSTIELGHNLGLKVTAEGVEDEKSAKMLKEYGCDTLQGYFISRPLPAPDLEAFLADKGY
ncbi:bifunctional diguanylate cyclase/phosphodiesterase [Kordiimonas pumila]|uniref:EAL domain-containing protein n=1 Tax=Kordiimonas pumila TaxID=2161677 RepID=A0ABV7D372_9PROT|nr:EAL domain-containing protein [Kordiimonas pumila]